MHHHARHRHGLIVDPKIFFAFVTQGFNSHLGRILRIFFAQGACFGLRLIVTDQAVNRFNQMACLDFAVFKQDRFFNEQRAGGHQNKSEQGKQSTQNQPRSNVH